MKPTKNRVFCGDCGKVKMLFKAEKKAENFIRFNSEEILKEQGTAPIRSYFSEHLLHFVSVHCINKKVNV
ncbi:MAG: hypothetical protein LBU27_04620 [Candidatus Peribacteria bacterium]|jgi:hypothetical protein|nr:hypothetical protein [Candidatus Peribacteria bacterium]